MKRGVKNFSARKSLPRSCSRWRLGLLCGFLPALTTDQCVRKRWPTSGRPRLRARTAGELTNYTMFVPDWQLAMPERSESFFTGTKANHVFTPVFTRVKVMREICSDEKSDEKWILLDGPVDTLWIESMNTVLDDNKLLTLINGERIAMPPQVSLLFEVDYYVITV